MCFSAPADLVGGSVVALIGADCLYSATRTRARRLLASVPLVLGAHQIVEGALWLTLERHLPSAAERPLLWAYLLVAFVLLPIGVPLAVRAAERDAARRRGMAPFVVLGGAVAAVLLGATVLGPIGARIAPHHLAYSVALREGGFVVVAYVIAVCGALLCSSDRRVVAFGLVNLVAVSVIAWWTVDGFASVWCGWAALSSAALALHLRGHRPARQPPAILAPS